MYNAYNFDLLIWEFEKKISLQCLSYVYLVKILIPQQNNGINGRHASDTAVNEGASTSDLRISPLPSGFRPPQSRRSVTLTAPTSRPTRKRTSGTVGRIRTWNKDVVCLPYSREGNFAIPRGKQRGLLAERGLIGKIRIVSSWSEMQVTIFPSILNVNGDTH